ncbi:hypothetical protein JTE90_003190 [Oedothorax gibbosus]|uniref:Single domain-containing protein n=1 Tax=Oedothorax gibbosus TaxID=931172 RepID=A0AAV6UQP5_9ARAC|nr:hypothetical protein JTE90_003190 [Oedothorax gibbosus]
MFFRFLLLSALVVCAVNAYMYRGEIDTSGGACVGSWGSIPVGEEGYDDEKCERISCSEGMKHVAGCGKRSLPKDSKCRLVKGTGHYPDCCPKPKCD